MIGKYFLQDSFCMQKDLDQ